jgi:hypothetical protein
MYCGTLMFITVFTRALLWPLSRARLIQPMLIPSCLSKNYFDVILAQTNAKLNSVALVR